MIHIDQTKQIFHLTDSHFSYVLKVHQGKLLNLYWGAPLAHADLDYLIEAIRPGASFELTEQRTPLELPTTGTGWYGMPAVQAENADGNSLTSLEYRSYRLLPHKPDLPGLPHIVDPRAETLQIQLLDPLTGLEVIASYTVTGGGLARSLSITNHGPQPLTLTHTASASAIVTAQGLDIVHLRGAHARERQLVRTPLGQGNYTFDSQRGASGHEHNPFVALATPATTEDNGSVWSMNLIYSGSFLVSAQVRETGDTVLSIGLNPAVHQWRLESGARFDTPEALLVYSSQGLNGMSHIYHHVYRDHLCQSPWNHRPRPILINNWEATYFNFTEEKILQIAQAAAQLGIELFVLDDGWFGQRDDDHRSLGDWYVNTRKLPHGLKHLAEQIEALGLRFGLWFEPEMISPSSDLYRAHPDWCLHAPGRPRTEGRHQLILDLGRPEVQQFIINMMKETLSSAPISYVKWDMNRNMTEAFSAALPPERQMETQHRYMLGLYHVLEEITKAFPEVLFESCSGGGGRFDAGMLYYMPQTWTSDNTDAIERLGIQYGTSLVYPPSAMGAHISASPNHQVGRVTTMQMRGDVALSGNFGFELDLSRLSAEDRVTAKAFVNRVKALRTITQGGMFTRLISPFEGSNYAAWQFTYEDQVLLCCFRKLNEPNPVPHRVYLKDLDEHAFYRDEAGHTYSGAALMHAGLPMTFFPQHDFTSYVTVFTQQKG